MAFSDYPAATGGLADPADLFLIEQGGTTKQLPAQFVARATSFNVAGLPAAASYQGCIALVLDEVGGSVLAFSDGVFWRRVTDRAVVSS